MRFQIKFPLFALLALGAALALIACAPDMAGPVAAIATAPVAYVHQEYPKWVGDVLVHNETEEIAQLEKLNPGETSNEGVGEDSQDGYSTLTLPPEAPASAPQPPARSGQQASKRR